ncbi:diacylglycerol kinase family protein [soil metagenome]
MGADICVIVNAGSGKQKGAERLRAIEEACAPYPGRFTLRPVEKGGEIEAATQAALKEGFAAIVAGGGDGTISAVAGVLAGTECRMGVLPLGTFNYFARSLDLPEDLGEAVGVIAEGSTVALDVGEVNGRVFLNNASLGAYPAILKERESIYRRWGRSRFAAYWSVLVTLTGFRKPLHMRLTIDGAARDLRTPLISIAKNAHQLEQVGLDGGECITSGQFAIFIAPDAGRLGLVRFAVRLALGLSEPREDFDLICGSEIELVTRRPRRLVARDGERETLESSFRFQLRRGALQVLAPRAGP